MMILMKLMVMKRVLGRHLVVIFMIIDASGKVPQDSK